MKERFAAVPIVAEWYVVTVLTRTIMSVIGWISRHEGDLPEQRDRPIVSSLISIGLRTGHGRSLP